MTYRIIWRNTMTKECFVSVGTDVSTSKDFYRFPLPMDLTRGEYEYYIIDADGELEVFENDPRKSTIDGERVVIYDQGVAQVGKINRRGQIIYNITKKYQQYGG